VATQPVPRRSPQRVAVKHRPGLHRVGPVGLGGQDGIDEDLLERRSVGHQPERRELGGNVIGEFIANLAGKPRLKAPVLNKEMRRFDRRHAARIAAVRVLGTCPIG
jgi:hypothetical protein